MIGYWKGTLFAACSLAAILMPFATGRGEDASRTGEEELTQDEWNKILPITASMPCPMKNMRCFTTVDRIVSREDTAKCYLVDIENVRMDKVRIYLISDREGLAAR